MESVAGEQSTHGTRVAALAGILVLGLFVAHVVYYWPQINDDAFITFRYSKFLTLGRGPYFNVGEQVEGYSNPLMMWLMAALIGALDDDRALVSAKTIGVVGGMATLIFTWLLCLAWLKKLGPHTAAVAWLAPALVAVQSGYALNATTGLETTLFSAWIVLGLWLVQKGEDDDRWRGGGLAFALGALTRPEGGAVFAAALAGRLVAGAWRGTASRQRWIADGGVVAVTVGALLLFRWFWYEGHLLPNTYHAKLGGLGGGAEAADYLLGFARRHLAYLGWLPSLLPMVAGAAALRRATLPALTILLFGTAGIFLTGAGWMPGYRLLAPYVPVWAALSVAGLHASFRWREGGRRAVAGSVACAILLVGLTAWQHPSRVRYRKDCVTRARGYVEGHTALADWLLRRARPGQTVGLMDIGIVGFRCVDLRILDVTGLTDRRIAMSPGGFLRKRLAPDYVLERLPDYLVIVYAGPPEIRPLEPVRLIPWTEIERRLVLSREFQTNYARPKAVDPRADLLTQLAARYGAERVFRHDYPGRSYLLFVHALRDPPPAPTPPGARRGHSTLSYRNR